MNNYVDIQAGIATMANMESIYNKVVDSFIKNYSNFNSLIKNLLNEENANYKEARRHVHSIKGISLNLGSKKLYDISAKYENIILEQDVKLINDTLDVFLNIFNHVYSELDIYLKQI